MPKPAVGRTVHYVSHGTPPDARGQQAYTTECRAAIITEVPDLPDPQVIGLCVLNPTGQFFNRTNLHDSGHEPGPDDKPLCNGLAYGGGTWHWAERIG